MKRIFAVIVFFLGLTLSGCGQLNKEVIITVTGPVAPSEMGTTLSHEHLLVDFIGADSTGYHRWNRDSVVKKAIPFLEALKPHEVTTFIECTPAYIGRDPLLMKRISEETGMQILTNTGYYGARQNKFVPDKVFEMKPEELASIWIGEFMNGIEDTGIKPGFIKIGVDAGENLSEKHKLLVHAAALAHQQTGLTIVSHTGPEAPAFEQLEILAGYEIPAKEFIWVHAQNGSLEGNLKAAEKGAWVSLDNVNAARDKNPGSKYSTVWYVERLSAFKEAGLLDRVLVSHDAGWYRPGEPNGGYFRGFTDVFTSVIPALKGHGFSDEEIRQIMVTNPARAFSIQIP